MDHHAPRNSIELVLASHTNVGKTSLARTLLARDVGDVRDEAHVTQFSDRYTWLETARGASLKLWDTPGFGDSQRLLKRLRRADTLGGWLLTEVWDRWLYPGFHFSQKVLRTIQDEADVVLYLASAAESPGTSAYLDAEMQLLECIGKPVIVLINQSGGIQDEAQETADVGEWQAYCASHPLVARVLPLDAFARCWVRELVLLDAIRDALPDQHLRGLMDRLIEEWRGAGLRVFGQSMQVLATSIARCAVAREQVTEGGGLRAIASRVKRRSERGETHGDALAALRKKMDRENTQAVAELAALSHLDATLDGDPVSALQPFLHRKKGISESRSTLVGAVATGALSGLAADVAAGGLTLGGGMLVGGIAGALGGKAAAAGYNRVVGTAEPWIEWDAQALDALFEHMIMSYLVIAHAGRGRGEAVLKREHPRWSTLVPEVVASYRTELAAIWNLRGDATLAREDAETRIREQLLPLLDDATWRVLETLYPDAAVRRAG